MSNEFRHASVGDELSQSEWESIATHVFNSQAKGDILYASSATQLSRLGIGTEGQPLTVSASGIPQWGGNVSIGASLLKTTNLAIKEYNTTSIALRNAGDTAFRHLYLDSLHPYNIDFSRNGDGIRAENADNAYAVLMARDNGNALAEIARLQGAADPYFSMGGSQETKFYNSGAILLEASGLSVANIPTEDPEVAGQIWSNGGVLTVSAGA